MSIQETISSQKKGQVFLDKLKSRLHLEWQKISRLSNISKEKIYYPYQNLFYTHPFFERYYRQPPVKYCNYYKAELCHWVSFLPKKKLRDVPYIIEPQDHPLSPAGESEPAMVLNLLKKTTDTYMSSNCKKILVESEGQLNLFKRYLPDSVMKKTEIVRLGAVPKIESIEEKDKKSEKLTFVCLASDYKRKAVDLLISAWLEFSLKSKCQLILACPNIPHDVSMLIESENINVIKKAPLSAQDKHMLLSSADIVIAPLHVDGGANVLEAFEYGLPVITMRSQRSFIRNNNGWEVDVPFYFYDDGYGKEWPTWDVFWKLLDDAKTNHEFDITVQGFVNVFEEIARSPEILLKMGKSSYNLACGEFSLERRNEKLRNIYRESL